MIMNAKSIILFVVALILTVGILVSCTNYGEGNNETTVDSDQKEFCGGLDRVNYEGKEYKILTFSDYALTFAHEESGAGTMEDAVYRQCVTVEDYFNVKVMPVLDAGVSETLRTAVSSGEDAFDIVICHNQVLADHANEGNLTDLNILPNLDLSKEYWNQTYVDKLTVNDRIYLAFGDLFYEAAASNVHMFYFNKTMIEDLTLESPYENVYNGTWTVEKLKTMSKDAVKDLNGDNAYSVEDDQFGLTIAPVQAAVMFYTSGFHVFSYDGSNVTLDFYNEKYTDFYSDVYDLLYNTESVHTQVDGAPNFQAFLDGRALFTSWFFTDTASVRAVEGFDVGLLPYPKWSEDEEYINWPTAGNFLMGVPSSVVAERYAFVGNITQALAATGNEFLRSAFYEKTLKGKLSRDEDSEKMIDIIFETMTIDFGWINCGTGSMGWFTNTCLEAKLPSTSSLYNRLSEKGLQYYEDVMSYYNQDIE